MKKIMLIVCGIVFTLTLMAQPPQGINYQAVVRNSLGELVSNQTVNFRFYFRTESETGTIVYTEIQDITTDEFGLASLVIGNGTPETGTFDAIDWSGGNIWIEVEMDITGGGTTYVSMGAEQFQSVPYALYSGSDWKTSGDDLYYNEGNVGIGTDAPTEKLEVVGDVFINNNDLGVEQSIFLGPSSPTVSIGREAGSRTMLLKSAVDGMASGAGFKFLINDEDKLILDEYGNLGIAGKVKMEGLDIGSATDSLVSWNPADSTLRLIPNTTDAIADADGDTRIQVEASPDEDVIHFDMAGTEFFRMDNGRLEVFNTGNNVFMGAGAGANDDFSYSNNVAIGYNALNLNTTGYKNTAYGYYSLYSNTTGDLNTAYGSQSLYSNTSGEYNTAFGIYSLNSNTAGSFNTAIGYFANVDSGNLINATAIGANAVVSQSNSLVLGNNANVGIGTTAPDAALDVVGDLKLSDWFDQDLSPNGYAKMGPIIIQWGTNISTSDDSQNFNFPTAFDNACFSVVTQRMSGNAEHVLAVTTWGTTYFTINRDNSIDGSNTFTWIAVGY